MISFFVLLGLALIGWTQMIHDVQPYTDASPVVDTLIEDAKYEMVIE